MLSAQHYAKRRALRLERKGNPLMPQKLRSIKTPKPEPRQPKPAAKLELAPIQELLCDLTCDLLLNGGRREETELLLTALLTHQWLLNFPQGPPDPTKALEEARSWASKGSEEAYNHLVAAWPKKPTAAKEPTPKTLTERIRQSTRNEVQHLFGEFLGGAAPEELYLMREILQERDSYHRFADGSVVQEIYLGTAIQSAIGSYGNTHIKVPQKMVPLIEKLVAARQEIEEEEECA
jgi:hypothetical protein